MKRIRLSNGMFSIVDDEDYHAIAQFKWQAVCSSGVWRAQRMTRRPNRTCVLMHRQILGVGPGEEVDHINRDGLDNRKSNLRLCTRQQNNANMRDRPGSSRFKGVCRQRGRWLASTKVNRRHKHLGYFDREEDAARAYDRAARRYFGEFARTNFPGGEG